MTKKKIKQLVSISYKDRHLNKSNVLKIAKYLTRSELKLYIKALIKQEKMTTVQVILPQNISDKDKNTFSKAFKNKKVVFDIDSSLIMGVKIIDNDLVYNITLQQVLKNMLAHISSV